MFHIYKLVDPREPNVIRYIGKTSYELRKRLTGHIRDSNKDTHKNRWIRSLLKNGMRPQIISLFQADEEKIDWKMCERYFIRVCRQVGIPLTNDQDGGEGWTKGGMSPETREKISAAHRGKKLSAEHRKKIAATLRSPEVREKNAAAHRGKKLSAEHRKKISEGGLRRPPESEETRKRRSLAQKGRKIIFPNGVNPRKGTKSSPETCAKISAVQKGKVLSEEHKRKISDGLKRALASPEVRKKISDGLKRALAAKKTPFDKYQKSILGTN